MKVSELIKDLEGVDGDVDVRIIIESGRGLRISDDVELYYDEESKDLRFVGVETDYD